MGVITSYVLVLLPLSIRMNNWNLACCSDRRVAYLADGLSQLMINFRQDQLKRNNR